MATRTSLNKKDSKALAVLCAKTAFDKLGSDITLMNIASIDGAPSDWFVIVTVQSDPQLSAIAEEIQKTTKGLGVDIPRAEGKDSSNWVILDYFDVVVHIMKPEARTFYKLEKMWGEAEFLTISKTGRAIKAKREIVRTNSLDDA